MLPYNRHARCMYMYTYMYRSVVSPYFMCTYVHVHVHVRCVDVHVYTTAVHVHVDACNVCTCKPYFFHDIEAVEIGLLSRHYTSHDQFPDDEFLSLHHHCAAPHRVESGGPGGAWTLSLGERESGRGGERGRGGAEDRVWKEGERGRGGTDEEREREIHVRGR